MRRRPRTYAILIFERKLEFNLLLLGGLVSIITSAFAALELGDLVDLVDLVVDGICSFYR